VTEPAGLGRPGLVLADLGKSYAGVAALDGVTLEIQRGTVHCLVGGNGSGKSTLVKLLAGVVNDDARGTVTIGDRTVDASDLTPRWAREAGLRFVHQDIGVFDDMTVAENLAVVIGYPTRIGGGVDWAAVESNARSLLDRFGLAVDPSTPAGALRPAARTMLAIARALHDQSSERGDDGVQGVLVLDEPTAALPAHESAFLRDMLRRYAAQGHTIVLITHHLSEVLEVADGISVLRDGRHVTTRPASGLSYLELVELIVGSAIPERWERPAFDPENAVHDGEGLVVSGLCGGLVRDLDLRVGRGEVVGIAGMRGSGRSQVVKMIAGVIPPTGGRIAIDGVDLPAGAIISAIDAGVAYVPEDRDREAAFGDLDVRSNLLAARVHRYLRRGRLDTDAEQRDATRLIGEFGIRTRGDRQTMSTLSGGNRQKVVLARWLSNEPTLLLLDEPSQGVDVGARAEIHRIVEHAVEHGAAAVVVSSDFEELCLLCDRVVVMRSGRVVAQLAGHELSPARLTELSFAPVAAA